MHFRATTSKTKAEVHETFGLIKCIIISGWKYWKTERRKLRRIRESWEAGHHNVKKAASCLLMNGFCTHNPNHQDRAGKIAQKWWNYKGSSKIWYTLQHKVWFFINKISICVLSWGRNRAREVVTREPVKLTMNFRQSQKFNFYNVGTGR